MPHVEISTLAEQDLDNILQHTFENYGEEQMLKYNDQLINCMDTISTAQGLYKKIENRGKVIRFIRCQKHYIFALERNSSPILIIAILHEKMDLIKRVVNRL